MAHNGGRSQIGHNFPGSGAFAYLNVLKDAEWWVYGASGELALDPSQVNSDGYPTTVPGPGTLYTAAPMPSQSERPGDYVFKWTGTATFSLHFGSGRLVSGSLSGTNGRAVFTPTDSPTAGAIYIALTAVTTLTQMVCCHVDDEGLLDAGEVFGTRFLDILRAGNWGAQRFMQWQVNNVAMLTAWSDRRPTTYFSYRCDEYRPSMFTGTTSIVSSNVYTAPLAGYTLTDKAHAIVKFHSTASSTTYQLAINSTAAKPLRNQYGATLSVANSTVPYAGQVGFVVYDSTLDCYLKDGGDLGTYNKALTNGVPVEVMVDLANVTSSHPWFCLPYLGVEGDFMGQLATYAASTLSAGLVPRFECCNELWNTAGGFYSTPFAINQANAWWGAGDDYNNWYGRALAKMGAAVASTYAFDSTRYQIVCGVQTYGVIDSSADARLESPKYSSSGAAPASSFATHVAVANYWAPFYYNTATETAQADLYAIGQSGQIVEQYVTELQYSQAAFTQGNAAVRWVAWKDWADSYGLRLNAYEGGFSPDYIDGQTNNNALREAAKAIASVSTLTTGLYDAFVNAGGEFPSHYVLSGADVIWSLFDADIYATPSPQYDAICAYNEAQSAPNTLLNPLLIANKGYVGSPFMSQRGR
jgi:hypothetical protein